MSCMQVALREKRDREEKERVSERFQVNQKEPISESIQLEQKKNFFSRFTGKNLCITGSRHQNTRDKN